jgi:lipopolysaccharide transport system permease protein
MISALKLLFKHRKILFATSMRDIYARYMGTALGLSWSVFYPILFLGLYSVVYTLILKIRLAHYTNFDYVILIFSGLIPFLGFTEALGTGVSCIISNKNLIKNTLFPVELIPAKAVIISSVTMLVGLLILMVVLWGRGAFHYSQLLLPLLILLQFLFTLGIIWILSAVNVFFRDISQMVTIMIVALMLVSPIGYTIDMIPKHLMILMYPNPLFYLIMLYRDALMLGIVPIKILCIFSLMTIGVFSLGYFVFSRLKYIFADYV